MRRQSRTYDSLGRPSLVTQYDAATSGNVTDEVSYTYDGWGGVTSYKQDKDSAVGGSGFYEMAYTYAKATTGRNTIRRSQMTLPGGKVVDLSYTTNKDGSCSRVSALTSGGVILASYGYLGAAHVVRTSYPEPNITTRVYDPATDSYSGHLDRFGRITKNAWYSTTPNPDVAFYDVDISYDRNSNITWVEDNVHAGFDVKYAMDDLDRLIDAEEGTRSGGSVTSRTRHQTWTTLDHVGNWGRSKLDLDGDNNWNETEEYDDTRTHNAVNELETRDTDSNASVNFTLAYDAAGNMTDDGEDYEYVYDAFYRLRQVNNQSSTVLAEYRYNGLGHMIAVLEDTNASGGIDGSDVTFHPAYDEGWREVARYRSGDTSPKEQFVNATAGLDGYGRSSYINDVVLRDRDNTSGWLAASDGTLEERYYYCPNWRGDVSALIHHQRYMAEWVKYSPYGIPFGLPGGDTNSDGDNDTADATQIQAWIDAPANDVRGDVDLDGDVDSTDKGLAQAAPINGNSLGWYTLGDDAFHNRRGSCGYESHAGGVRYHVRHREYVMALGLWIQRDPKMYVDGLGLYLLVKNSPLRFVDAQGTQVTGPASGAFRDWLECVVDCLSASELFREKFNQLVNSDSKYKYERTFATSQTRPNYSWGGAGGYQGATTKLNPHGSQGSSTNRPRNGTYDVAHELWHAWANDTKNSTGGSKEFAGLPLVNPGNEDSAHWFAESVLDAVNSSLSDPCPQCDPLKPTWKWSKTSQEPSASGTTCGTPSFPTLPDI